MNLDTLTDGQVFTWRWGWKTWTYTLTTSSPSDYCEECLRGECVQRVTIEEHRGHQVYTTSHNAQRELS